MKHIGKCLSFLLLAAVLFCLNSTPVHAQTVLGSYTVQQSEEDGYTLNYTADLTERTAKITSVQVEGTVDLVIPDTIIYTDTETGDEIELTVISILTASSNLTHVRSVTVPDDFRTILGNLFDWRAVSYPTDAEIMGGDFPHMTMALFNTGIPDTEGMLSRIPSCVSDCYEDGAYYAGKCLVRVDPAYNGNFAVKDGTVCILASAFEGCKKIGAVTLPDSVEFIGDRAFANSSVTSVNLPAGLDGHSNVIPQFTFFGCDQLKTVKIECTKLSSIEYCAFMYCSALTGFDFSKVDSFNSLAFAYAFADGTEISLADSYFAGTCAPFYSTGIKKVTFGTGISETPVACFMNCAKLEQVVLSSSIKSLYANCFEGCTALKTDILAQENCAVQNLGYRCLARTGVTEITIPKTVTSMNGAVFAKNPQLATLNWYSDRAYTLFSVLNDGGNPSASMPGTSTNSGSDSYAAKPEKNGNTFITTLNIYAQITPAFGGTSSPVGAGPFGLQPYLETVNIHNAADTAIQIPIGMFEFCPALTTVTFDHPEKVTEIGPNAFAFCPGLHDFPFTKMTSLSRIRELAFMLDNASYSNADVTAFKDARASYGLTGTLDLSACSELTSLGSDSFMDQYHITGLKLPAQASLNGPVFIGCASLKDITADCPLTNFCLGDMSTAFWVKPSRQDYTDYFGSPLHTSWGMVYNDVIETITCTNTGSISSPCFVKMPALKSVTLKNTAGSISAPAFVQCIGLEEVNLPDLTSMPVHGIFYGCNDFKLNAPMLETMGDKSIALCGIKELYLPSLTTIDSSDQPFVKCLDLETVNLPKLTKVGHNFFSNFFSDNLPSLKTVILPEVTEVENSGFFATAATDIRMPKLRSIGDNGFFGSQNLKTLTIPAGVTFGIRVFQNCDSLTDVVVEEGVTELGWYMFTDCDNLANVSLPSTLETLSWAAFKDCPALNDVRIPAGVTIDDDVFVTSNSTRPEDLRLLMEGAPARIITEFDEATLDERRVRGDMRTAENIDGWFTQADLDRLAALLPVPDGSLVYCLNEAAADAATAYKDGYAPDLSVIPVGMMKLSGAPGTVVAGEDLDLAVFAVTLGDTTLKAGEYKLDYDKSDKTLGERTVTVTVLADAAGYTDRSVSAGPMLAGTQSGKSFLVTKPASAEFVVNVVPKEATVTVSVKPDGSGSAAVNGESTVIAGTKVTVTATPNEGYEFTGWTLNGKKVSSDKKYTFTAAEDCELVANFQLKSFTVIFKNEDGTQLQSVKTTYGKIPAYTGKTPKKAATAKYTYSFAGWSPKLKPADADATYTATYMSKAKPEPDPTGTPEPGPEPSAKGVAMYRLYNKNSGEHFYTANAHEKDYLSEIGWRYEGIGWYAPKTSNTPVYRLYNQNAGDHHYTRNKKERDHLISLGWRDEGIGWYSDDAKGVPLYRQYNPNAVAGAHNYTKNKRENDYLVSLGWREEGVGWYGMQ